MSRMKVEQDKFFQGMEFEKCTFAYPCGAFECYKSPSGEYFRIDHFGKSYVIEYAENEEEAKANCFDDGDLFDDSMTDAELIKEIQKSIVEG